jgi:UDP-N-acetylglucosamine 2-epimerase (non-hydrolysing)
VGHSRLAARPPNGRARVCRVLVVLGTRPEAIKLAPLIRRLRENSSYRCRVCVTGQHRAMLKPMLESFGIVPDDDLDLMTPSQTLTSLAAGVLHGVDKVLEAFPSDVAVVQGDTTTAFAAALAAFHRGVPVAHVEAGLRTGDLANPFPEEANRRLIASVARWHCAPTSRAKDHLIAGGVASDAIAVTGNTGIDALLSARSRICERPVLERELKDRLPWLGRQPRRRRVLVTAHRRESFGAGLSQICKALRQIARRNLLEVVWPVHLNPNVEAPVRRELGRSQNIRLLPPQEYLPFVYLMMNSYLILTDSGGIQEEAPSLGVPVLVMRAATERTEAIDAGVARLVGTSCQRIVDGVEELVNDTNAYDSMRKPQNPFGDGHASERIEHSLSRWLNAPG